MRRWKSVHQSSSSGTPSNVVSSPRKNASSLRASPSSSWDEPDAASRAFRDDRFPTRAFPGDRLESEGGKRPAPGCGSSWLTSRPSWIQSSPMPHPGASYRTTCTSIQCLPMSAPGIFRPPPPVNEPAHEYAPGSIERESLIRRLGEMRNERVEIPLVIGSEDVRTGTTRE